MRVIGKRNQKRRERLAELRGAIISNSSALSIMPGLFDDVAPDILLDFRMELCSQTGMQSLLGMPARFRESNLTPGSFWLQGARLQQLIRRCRSRSRISA